MSSALLGDVRRVVRFTVAGAAQTKGSAKAFVPFAWAQVAVDNARKTGKKIPPRAVITNDNANAAAWQTEISALARIAFNRADPFSGGVVVDLAFYLPRPQRLKDPGLAVHETRPDVDKLARCVLDGLTSIAYRDDGQVGELRIRKAYAAAGTAPRVEIMITSYTVDGFRIAEPLDLFEGRT